MDDIDVAERARTARAGADGRRSMVASLKRLLGTLLTAAAPVIAVAQEAAPAEPVAPIFNYYAKGGEKFLPNFKPADPYGPARMQMPTPVRGHDFHGTPDLATSTRPDTKTIGLRLDDTYGLFRSIDTGLFMSEYQTDYLGGFTIMPLQTPCYLVGLRAMFGEEDNMSVRPDATALSFDLYAGTRYKALYSKFGVNWDHKENYGKTGLSVGFLFAAPIIHNMTIEGSFSKGYGGDIVGPERGEFFRLRRVEVADIDWQTRIGTFLTPELQMGAVYNYNDWDFADPEYSAGLFANYFAGRNKFGMEISGGDEGLRGFLTWSYSFGTKRSEQPTDCNIPGVPVLDWISRPVDRDLSVRSRYSWTGN
jgi:hypothetical protein